MATGVEDMAGVAMEGENPKADAQEISRPAKISKPDSLPLLLEVGCEEIPARFLREAEKGLGERILAALTDARLIVSSGKKAPLQTFSTPRRLTVYVPRILRHQPDKVEE